MWKCYEIRYEAKSALHIGYGLKMGIITKTRYYIPGKTMWGAITAAISRKIMESYDAQLYIDIGKLVKERLIFSYFYPAKDCEIYYPNYTEEGIKFGGKSKEEFEKEFISSYISTGINKTLRTAEEGSLHEFEVIKPIEFVGYLLVNSKDNQRIKINSEEIMIEVNGKSISLFETIKELQIGGERTYGFGKMKLMDKNESNKFFDKYEIKLDDKLIVENADIAFSHVVVKDNYGCYLSKLKNVKGDLEPLVSREWDENKGAGQRLSRFEGIALVPGSSFDPVKMEIQEYGIWKPLD